MNTVQDVHSLINTNVDMNEGALSLCKDNGTYIVVNDRIAQFDDAIGCLIRLLDSGKVYRLPVYYNTIYTYIE